MPAYRYQRSDEGSYRVQYDDKRKDEREKPRRPIPELQNLKFAG